MTQDDYRDVITALEAVMEDAQALIERMEHEGIAQRMSDDYEHLHALYSQAARQHAHYSEGLTQPAPEPAVFH